MKDFCFLVFILFIALQIACGDGSVKINKDAGTASTLPLGNLIDTAAQQKYKDYYTTNLYPIMSLPDQSQGGCAVSGCHLINDAFSSDQTFFQVDPSSSDNSWNWAKLRRDSVTEGKYATSAASTLKAKKNLDHNAFANWTSDQKELIDAWTALQP